MTQNADMITLRVHVDTQDDVDTDELYRFTRDLQVRLERLDVASVEPTSDQVPQPGTKGVDPITVGALIVVVVQTALPKVVDFLQAWSLRNQGNTVKVEVQRGNQAIKVEFSETTDPEKIKKHIETVLGSMEKKKNH